jgi:hypothetical protein
VLEWIFEPEVVTNGIDITRNEKGMITNIKGFHRGTNLENKDKTSVIH